MPRKHQRQKKTIEAQHPFPKLLLTITTEPDGDCKITESRYKVSSTARTKEAAVRGFWEIARAEAEREITNDLDTTGVAEKMARGEIAIAYTVSNAERVQYFKDIVAQEEKFERVLVKKEKKEDDAMEAV